MAFFFIKNIVMYYKYAFNFMQISCEKNESLLHSAHVVLIAR